MKSFLKNHRVMVAGVTIVVVAFVLTGLGLSAIALGLVIATLYATAIVLDSKEEYITELRDELDKTTETAYVIQTWLTKYLIDERGLHGVDVNSRGEGIVYGFHGERPMPFKVWATPTVDGELIFTDVEGKEVRL